jgi:RimJ/RimL family protein N-acetyltransferase
VFRLETDRLILRPPRQSDLDSFAPFHTDPEVMEFIGGVASRDETVVRLDLMIERWRADGFGDCVIERRQDGVVVGRCGLLVWDPVGWLPGTRAEFGVRWELELGWMLGRPYWGNGYAIEAAAAIRALALAELRPQRLISLIHAENARSLAVAARLGTHVEGEALVRGQVAAQIHVHPTTCELAPSKDRAGRSAWSGLAPPHSI